MRTDPVEGQGIRLLAPGPPSGSLLNCARLTHGSAAHRETAALLFRVDRSAGSAPFHAGPFALQEKSSSSPTPLDCVFHVL